MDQVSESVVKQKHFPFKKYSSQMPKRPMADLPIEYVAITVTVKARSRTEADQECVQESEGYTQMDEHLLRTCYLPSSQLGIGLNRNFPFKDRIFCLCFEELRAWPTEADKPWKVPQMHRAVAGTQSKAIRASGWGNKASGRLLRGNSTSV